MSDNLWPDDFGQMSIRTPVSILREQAQALGSKTGNVVVGRVRTVGQLDRKFLWGFDIFCAPLSYQMLLLTVEHGIVLYPVEIVVMGVEEKLLATTPEELTAHLREIFSRDTTKKIIASMIAQSRQ
jgi:hypothetical protein